MIQLVELNTCISVFDTCCVWSSWSLGFGKNVRILIEMNPGPHQDCSEDSRMTGQCFKKRCSYLSHCLIDYLSLLYNNIVSITIKIIMFYVFVNHTILLDLNLELTVIQVLQTIRYLCIYDKVANVYHYDQLVCSITRRFPFIPPLGMSVFCRVISLSHYECISFFKNTLFTGILKDTYKF